MLAKTFAIILHTSLAVSLCQHNGDTSVYQTRFDGVTWDACNWRLRGTLLNEQGHYQSRPSIANGYIGISVSSAGPFFEIERPVNGDVVAGYPIYNERVAFAGVSGFWEDVRQSADGKLLDASYISGLPHWADLILDLGQGEYLDANVDNAEISQFSTTYDYRAGILQWSYTWTPKNSKAGPLHMSFDLFTHKLNINQAVVRMSVTPAADWTATVANVLNGYSALRTSFVKSGVDGGCLYSAVSPNNVKNITGYVYTALDGSDGVELNMTKLVTDKPYIYKNESTIAEAVNVTLSKGKTTTITKYIGIASSDAFSDAKTTAKNAALEGKQQGFDKLLASHMKEWAHSMPETSVDQYTFHDDDLVTDSFALDQDITAVVNTYYLLQNIVSENALKKAAPAPIGRNSIAVGGLGTDTYAGLIFWDADTWMQPGLVAAFPNEAKAITQYRAQRYQQAQKNIAMHTNSSQKDTQFSSAGAVFPWTSGRYGECGPGAACFDYQYHINGDIGTSLINEWVVTGDDDTFERSHLALYDSIATFYNDLLVKTGDKWTVTKMSDPDEYANDVDGGAYLMSLISHTLRYANQFRKQFGQQQVGEWEEKADNTAFVRVNNITLEFSTMNNSVLVKQADVVLNTYPLTATLPYGGRAQALIDLSYYSHKQDVNGPAMTWAIFSIVANAIAETGCEAYTYAQYSYFPYLRPPFYQFSEQIDDNYNTNSHMHPAFPFLTGHGGANQIALFGYLGLRLLPDDILHINPSLPPQIQHLRYRMFYWRGWPISAESNYTHTILTRLQQHKPLETANVHYTSAPIKVQVGSKYIRKLLHDGTPLVIANRKLASEVLIKGNLVQCQAVDSRSPTVPGQFAIAAVDGAAATIWQPLNTELASLKVVIANTDRPVTAFYFDWAQSPPLAATVVLHDSPNANETAAGTTRLAFDVDLTQLETPVANNDTTVRLPHDITMTFKLPAPVHATKFATLFIQGIRGEGNGSKGATVAEFAVVADI